MRILSTIFILLLLAGCATVYHPGGHNDTAIIDEKKSIVFFRFFGNIDGMPASKDDFFIELANIDRYEIPKKHQVKSFGSNEARKNGWVYLELEPGTYYFTVIPGQASQDAGPESLDADTGIMKRSVFGNIIDMTTFWFNLPKGVPVMYIGTFSFLCAKKKDSKSVGLICTDIDIYDESEIAVEIAKKSLNQNKTMVTNILKKYGKCDKGEIERLMPLKAVLSSRVSLNPSELITISSDRTGGPGYGYLAGIPPGMPFIPFFYSDGFFYGYRPRGTSVGIGLNINNLFAPCFDKIADEIVKSNLTGMLEDYLSKISNKKRIAMFSKGNASEINGGYKGLLQIDIQRAHLTECDETWTFCTEVEARMRIFDPSTGRYACDSVIAYSNTGSGRPRGQGRYVLPVRKDSPCVYLDNWCGSEGSAMLLGQFAEAMKTLSYKIVHDLGH